MEGLITREDYDGTNNVIAKGKRTKRLRLLTPSGVVAAASISSCSSGSMDHGNSFSISSSTTIPDQEEEDEDMANCLILLARGNGRGDFDHHQNQKADDDQDLDEDDYGDGKVKDRKISEMGVINNNVVNKVGLFIYECKTCNRTFPSFQALGGHRASHKRPKLATDEKKPPPQPPTPLARLESNYDDDDDVHHEFELELGGGEMKANMKIGGPISVEYGGIHKNVLNNNKGKIHECSICGSEFTSGQALGGHMRRHRASTTTTTTVMGRIEAAAAVPPRNILELDLNLPAPEEEPSKFQFNTTAQKSMVLPAAPALVDCHY